MKEPLNRRHALMRLCYAALCFALCIVLPFLTGQIPEVGKLLCPMHLPVLLCGMLCGPLWGCAIGFVAPLVRSMWLGMPPLFPTALGMAFELFTYGLVSGLLARRFPRRLGWSYPVLLLAMLAGRLVGGVFQGVLLLAGKIGSYGWGAYLTAYFGKTLPGVALQLLLIPPVVAALRRAGLLPWEKDAW